MSIYFKYTPAEVLEELKRRAEENAAALEAWKKVTVKTKKGGGEYARLSQAMEGASVNIEYGLRRLYVYFSTPRKMYEHAYIDIYGYLDELPENDPRRAEYVKQFIRQKYEYTPEEVREAIKKEIARREEAAAFYEKQIAAAPEAVAAFREKIAEALQALDTTTPHDNGSPYHSSLYYIATETR